MNDDGDLVRLIASADATDLERRLLKSWANERPTPAALAHTLGALGLATGAGVGLGAGASVAPKAIAAGWLAMAKWTVGAAVVVAVAGGGAYAVLHHDKPSTTPQAPSTAITAVAPVAVTPRSEPTTIELPSTPQPTPRVVTATPPAGSISLQIAAVDRARSALDSGEPSRARHLVDSYEAEYPSGTFTQEAEVVRIDALVREGNRAEAERVGKRFLAAYPKSPHASRVRALLGYDP
jgi:TolA-binding protein